MTETSAVSRMKAFRDQLSRRVLVADGAMGTMLYDKGIFINRCYDELNLSSPDIIRQIHLDYVKAGAEILETNTFGGNRMRLAAFGLTEKLGAINRAGVKIARDAARDAAYVAGAVGPLGTNIEPLGPTSFDEARSIFREQVEHLVEAGADLLILETFFNLDELREAVFAAREVAGPEMVIVAQVTIDDFGNLRGGADTATFTRRLDEWPVDVIGANCSAGPKVMLETVEKMMRWGAGEHAYIRPVHSVVSIFDGAHLPLSIFNVASGETTPLNDAEQEPARPAMAPPITKAAKRQRPPSMPSAAAASGASRNSRAFSPSV